MQSQWIVSQLFNLTGNYLNVYKHDPCTQWFYNPIILTKEGYLDKNIRKQIEVEINLVGIPICHIKASITFIPFATENAN